MVAAAVAAVAATDLARKTLQQRHKTRASIRGAGFFVTITIINFVSVRDKAMRSMSMFRHALLLASTFHLAVRVAAAPPAPAEQVLVTISEKTTRITEPLNANGYPDFLEAVNLAAKGKITPETNGAILILKAVGLREEYPELTPAQKQEFNLRLGIDPLPEDKGDFVFSDDYVDALPESELPEPNEEERKLKSLGERREEIRTRVHHEFNHCSEQPWKAAEHPRVAEWLKQQAPAFAHLEKLREYPKCYLPTIAGARDRSLMNVEHPLQNPIRKLVFELNIRAMYSLGNGNPEAAIDDFERMLLFRSYLQSNQNGLVSNLTAISMSSSMHLLFNLILMTESLTATQLTRIESLVNKYDLLRETMIEATDQRERLFAIDIICRAAEFGLDGSEEKPLPLGKRQQFDYDLMLNQLNEGYDKLLTLARIENREDRLQAIKLFNDELYAVKKASESKVHEALAALSKAGRSKLFADRLQAVLMPAMDAAMDVEQKDQMRRELWQVAIALRKYREQHGKYPAELQQLTPQFLAKIPADRFADKPLNYQTDGRGLLLYSIGRDREDHQGYVGEYDDGWTDDIAIFTADHRPQPPKPAEPPRE